MKAYQGDSLLKKAAMRLFVQHLDPKSILNLRQEFKKIDTGQNGFIMVDEIRALTSFRKIKHPTFSKRGVGDRKPNRLLGEWANKLL